MSELHRLAALLAVAAAVAALLAAAAQGVAVKGAGRRLTDRAILAVILTTSLAALTGPLVLLAGRPLRDPLHALYGAAAVLALPLARYLVRAAPARRFGALLALGSLVLLGVLARGFGTGGA